MNIYFCEYLFINGFITFVLLLLCFSLFILLFSYSNKLFIYSLHSFIHLIFHRYIHINQFIFIFIYSIIY